MVEAECVVVEMTARRKRIKIEDIRPHPCPLPQEREFDSHVPLAARWLGKSSRLIAAPCSTKRKRALFPAPAYQMCFNYRSISQ